MNRVSRILRRNLGRLPGGDVLLVDPEPDAPLRELAALPGNLAISTSSHASLSRLQAGGFRASFEAAPAGQADSDHIVLNLPREKERLGMLLHASVRRLRAQGSLWLVGAKRSGIGSSARHIEQYFERVAKLDSASHCSLFEAKGLLPSRAFSLDDYETGLATRHAGKPLELRFLPGVFAHGRLDPGTELLLQTLEEHPVDGRVLDFASGCGVVGAAILNTRPGSEVVLLDDSAIAIEAGRRTLLANGLRAKSIPSNGLSDLTGRFECIVSNPPFHRGVEQDMDVAAGFFREAGTFLSENGRIRVVFNRHLPYAGWLRESFNHVKCLAQTRAFTVIEASSNP